MSRYKKSLLQCPFCGEGFRINCTGAYEHDNEQCILHGLEICNDAQLEKWNTRKPVKKVLERLESQAKQYMHRAIEHEEKGFQLIADKNYSKACSYEHAIEIVKEVGEGLEV